MTLTDVPSRPAPARARRWFWWCVLAGLAGGLLLAALVVNVLWFKPVSFRLFCERTFLRLAVQSPELMTQLGLADALGIDWFNSRLDDRSEAHARRMLGFMKSELAVLRRYDRSRFDAADRLSADVLDWYLETAVTGGERFFHHHYAIDQMEGIQVALPSFMANVHPLRSPRNAADYVRRLEWFGEAFDQVIARSRAQTAQGILPPRFVLRKILEQTREFVAGPARSNALYTVLAAGVGDLAALDAATRQGVLEAAEAAMTNVVYPAFQRLTVQVETLLEQATDDAGVWKHPDGAAFYAHCLRQHTSTDLSPDAVHETGLAEVERITAEMQRLLDEAAVPGTTVAGRMQTLSRDPRFLFSNDEAGRQAAVKHLQGMLDEADARMTNWFGARPRTGMEVRRVEPFREKSAAMGQYQQGSMDGTRPGIFYANLRNMEEFPRYSMRTLAYHEGVPGHHFQVSLAQELQGVPTFRKILPFTAYVEGWALYAERLMWEMGFHQDRFDNLGRLQDELFRAARLVVDTGLHHKRWSREQAIDYLKRTTGMAETDLVNEVDRYLVWPGQACAYKVGMLKILELRERAQASLGGRFSLKQFHDAVLLEGALPLSILERRVEEQGLRGRD